MEFVIIAEARADARIARELADRVISDETDTWLDPETVEVMRTWRGLEDGTGYTKWTDVKRLASARNIRSIGHRKAGRPGAVDFAQSRKAILLHERLSRSKDVPVLLLVRDMDRQPERALGMCQARKQPPKPPFIVIIAVANPKREAWVLNGYNPQNDAEQERLDAVKQEIGRDPRHHAHTLTASQSGAKNNAKRILDALDVSGEREKICWMETDLDTLRTRGSNTGLRNFLNECAEHLPPLFDESANR